MTKDELIMWHKAPATQEVLAVLEVGFPCNYRACNDWDQHRYMDGNLDVKKFLNDPERLWEFLENA